ncbi:MAG TPA: LysE family transporter [Microthrixaceae bacterium]|nr:LysE family transporter [Microthrixaceae bacterium]
MFFSNVLSGLVIGLPIMITLGPISLLLLNQGMDRGAKTAIPAAFGVATADFTYSSLAALAGTALVTALTPISTGLRAIGIAVVVWLAWRLAMDSRRQVADIRSSARNSAPSEIERTAQPSPSRSADIVGDDESDSAGDGTTALRTAAPEVQQLVAITEQGPFAHLGGARLAGAFYGVTLMNPMTIVLMSAVVIAGGSGVGTAGWAIGMTMASLIAHGGFVLAGAVLRRTCSELTLARTGMVSAGVLVLLAGHLAIS